MSESDTTLEPLKPKRTVESCTIPAPVDADPDPLFTRILAVIRDVETTFQAPMSMYAFGARVAPAAQVLIRILRLRLPDIAPRTLDEGIVRLLNEGKLSPVFPGPNDIARAHEAQEGITLGDRRVLIGVSRPGAPAPEARPYAGAYSPKPIAGASNPNTYGGA